MELHLHPDHLEILAKRLATAGRREIGGILVGESLGDNVFRVVAFSFQRSVGTECHFDRRPEEYRAFLQDFFERTGNDFARFNYLGEWHSHPSFAAHPSTVDHRSMQMIVEDEPAPPFAVLIVARLAEDGAIELGASAYRRARPVHPVSVKVVPRPPHDPAANQSSWWRRLMSTKVANVPLRLVDASSSGKVQDARRRNS